MNEDFLTLNPFDEAKTLNFSLEFGKRVQYNPGHAAFLQRSLARATDLKTRKLFKKELCKYCSRPWNDGFFSLKVLPKPVLGKRIRKILRKKVEAPQKLTSFERKLIKLVQRNQGNKLVLTCLSCRKRTVNQMAKCKHNNSNKQQGIEEKKKESTTKIKKKRKKDRFVGLNPEVVLKAASMKQNSSSESPTNNLKISKMITKNSKTVNMRSLNDQNSKFQASSPKSSIQQIDLDSSFQPDDVQNSKNIHSTMYKSGDSFFAKLQNKKRIEKSKEVETQRKIKNMRHNPLIYEMVMENQRKENKEKEKKTGLANFLRMFGNPVK